ncbi:MAG: hypothetical protein C0444_09810 [Microbacterium sp.]|nr:hypothetical protein [Microbacterium sp.]MBA4345050.1 hypothetical protein [Microbacterium sp.]
MVVLLLKIGARKVESRCIKFQIRDARCQVDHSKLERPWLNSQVARRWRIHETDADSRYPPFTPEG